jgi:crotonobetainyl-CoA:carnitine CoA-transferase CaiB-like acyl-CoA transferase
MKLPLSGYRVLTFENFGAGPYGSMFLADLGAEVIKIENRGQGGDATRGMGPALGEHDSHFFQTFNFNKRSVCLNLKTSGGHEAFRRLAATAHVVLNNLRGDQPEKLGLTYAQLAATNPRLVCAHLSAYGRDNERKGWPGYDYLMQAEAGFLHVTGEPGTPPARMGLYIVDFMTGITTALAIVSALLGVARDGKGGDVDVSLFDVALHQLTYPGSWYLNAGIETGRQPRSSHPSATPVQLFPTKDGWIFVMCMTEKFWRNLVDELGRPGLVGDERFSSVTARRENRDALTAVLDEVFREETTDHWLARLRHRLPAAPVLTLPQALDNSFAREARMVRGIPHPLMDSFRGLANPIKLDGERLPQRSAPALGADTESVLRELGYDDDALAALQRAGAT